MTIKILVPHLPESVVDATVVLWHKQQGDRVEKGENLIDLETDKVVLEVPALETGILIEVIKPEGAIVEANEILALLEPISETAPRASTTVKEAINVDEIDLSDEVALSPAVRRLINEHHLNPCDIKGSGKHDRIIKADVLDFLDQQKKKEASVDKIIITTSTESQVLREKEPPITSSLVAEDGLRPEQRVPMTRLRAKVAERLLQAQQNAAMLTTFNEVNMDAVMTLRKQYQSRFQDKHEIKLGFMSFFVKASIEALKKFPAINASIDETDILYHGYYDIGIAVTSPRGLVVPVVKDADQLDFAGIEKSINSFGLKAREGTLSYDDLKGGTFTITNGGIFGSMLSTPILNPPQCAILGMHGIKDRVMVEAGEMVIRPMMYLALSYDHRLVDGREAVQFLVMIKECLESPAHLLLNI
ncbi:MAG: 2-oxoglutarate dehydrogenase complex dihydrolipoyllysine-residue succinyltransferase [Methylococcales bacterium]|nr:2-oxoglutarate dehydrogenase complex dihydrolipoyllysine-residue succinyltransferase [Methylococcales bacterium]